MEADVKVNLLLDYLDKLLILANNGFKVETSIAKVQLEIERLLLV